MGKPTLLFLDEPTSSIDPESRKEIWDILLNLKENPNMITILTTHHLEEAEILSDSLSVLSFGEIIVSGTVDKIKRSFGVGYEVCIFPNSTIKDFKDILQNFHKEVIKKNKDIKYEVLERKIIYKVL